MESSEIEAIKEYIQATVKISELLDMYELSYKPMSPTRLKMCCPFHEEATPSMMVYLETNSFHCFGCARNGNAITFLMYYHKKTFSEVMDMFKDKASAGEALVFEKIGKSFETSAMDLTKYIRSNKYTLGVSMRTLLFEKEEYWDEVDSLYLEMDNFFENEKNLDKKAVDEFVDSIMGRIPR
jgi:hypothetical protein